MLAKKADQNRCGSQCKAEVRHFCVVTEWRQMTIAVSKWDIFELNIPDFDPYVSSFPSLVGIGILLLRGKCALKTLLLHSMCRCEDEGAFDATRWMCIRHASLSVDCTQTWLPTTDEMSQEAILSSSQSHINGLFTPLKRKKKPPHNPPLCRSCRGVDRVASALALTFRLCNNFGGGIHSDCSACQWDHSGQMLNHKLHLGQHYFKRSLQTN